MRLTIQDVARASGTSPSTVSRVLTGRVPVASDKREAILQAIAQLNYRPNLVARSLKTRATQSLGLLINDILNPYYGALARGVEDRASEGGYAVIFCNINEDPERERANLRMLWDKAVDGIILAPTGANREVMEEVIASGVALVQIDRRVPDLEASTVLLANQTGGRIATRHLIEQGHSRIGFVTYALGQMTVAEREVGYRGAMQNADLPISETAIRRVSFGQEDTPQLVREMLQAPEGPTALLAANNRIAMGILQGATEIGRRVGEDLALVVVDDLELYALIHPSITAVAQPAYEMGRQAADLLIQQMASPTPIPAQHLMFEPRLIVRASSQRRSDPPNGASTVSLLSY